jgi:hypothetical protein
MSGARDLNRIRLVESYGRGARVMEIREGQHLSLTAAMAYRRGWILREVNDKGEPIAAYCKESNGQYRIEQHEIRS